VTALVGDYISTSLLTGQQVAVPSFAIKHPAGPTRRTKPHHQRNDTPHLDPVDVHAVAHHPRTLGHVDDDRTANGIHSNNPSGVTRLGRARPKDRRSASNKINRTDATT
jgi:hypothetical protein